MTLRIFRITDAGAAELGDLPLVPDGAVAGLSAEMGTGAAYLWLSVSRSTLRAELPRIQRALHALTGSALLELHVKDLLNDQLPSHYDQTSVYDLLVLRRLAAATEQATPTAARAALTHSAHPRAIQTLEAGPLALRQLDTRPVGFVVFDRLLLSVHPDDAGQIEAVAGKWLAAQPLAPAADPIPAAQASDARIAQRVPPSPSDLMLRLAAQIVDAYLDLRRDLTAQLDEWQNDLVQPKSGFSDWGALMRTRQSLHQLDEICEDQRSAVQDWIDTMETLPVAEGAAAAREHELLMVRGRDVLEHIERVMHHVRRLQANAETAVQMHFSVQSQRTNDIMRVLTVLTAVFLPLNLIAGIFGMNFVGIPLLQKADGFWIAIAAMALISVALVAWFRRKRYLERGGR